MVADFNLSLTKIELWHLSNYSGLVWLDSLCPLSVRVLRYGALYRRQGFTNSRRRFDSFNSLRRCRLGGWRCLFSQLSVTELPLLYSILGGWWVWSRSHLVWLKSFLNVFLFAAEPINSRVGRQASSKLPVWAQTSPMAQGCSWREHHTTRVRLSWWIYWYVDWIPSTQQKCKSLSPFLVCCFFLLCFPTLILLCQLLFTLPLFRCSMKVAQLWALGLHILSSLSGKYWF